MSSFGGNSEEEIEELAPGAREPRRTNMGTLKLGGPRFDIDKYDGRTDYLLWERQVKGVLRTMGLGKVLRTRPTTIDEEEWDEIQEQAVSLVFLYLKPNVFKQVAVETNVNELFNSLQQKYHHKELSNRLYTSLKLMSFKMKEGDTKLQDHIDAFNDLVVDLENLGEDLSDERKALHLLSSLPTSYQSLSRVLLHRDKKTITYHEVVSALQTDDLQQKLVSSSQSSSSHPSALNVERGRSKKRSDDKGKPRNKSRSKSRGKSWEKGEIVCWKCGKSGHMKKDCKGKSVVSSSALVVGDDEGDLLNDDYVL